MKKLTLLAAVLFCGLLLASNAMAIPYKYVSKPHAPIVSAGTMIDAIYVSDNVPVYDVRVGIYAKVVMYSSLYITLTSPQGAQVVIKNANAGNTVPLYGFLGTDRSHALFMDCLPTASNPLGNQPNDKVSAPATALSTLNGKSSAGYWTLTISDERNYYSAGVLPQQGFLESWELMFNRQITVPPTPFTPPVDINIQGGGNLRGQINGRKASGVSPDFSQIPNATGIPALLGAQCVGSPPNPNGSLGQNGDCFPVIISGHPGAIIGQAGSGYPAGRFRVSVSVRTNYPGSSLFNAYTSDIAVFFGKTPAFNGSLPTPPATVPSPLVNRPWPQGPSPLTVPADRTTSLLGGSSGALGGIRLIGCFTPLPDPMGNNPDDGGIDITFDDLALNALTATTVAQAGGGLYGEYRPQQTMTFPAGTAVDGLYYVTVYDTFGEGGSQYGQLVVTNVHVEYIVGGGNIPDASRHSGIAGPLEGIPVPGTFTGAPFGYLSDVIGTIPPYSFHAKDQDPILAMWAMEKMYPFTSTGYEQITAMQTGGYNPPEGVRYDGPYSYSNPLVAGVPTENRSAATMSINADNLQLPTGEYKLRSQLVQARNDDYTDDNQMDSKKFMLTNYSMGYYGSIMQSWNIWNNPQQANLVANATLTAGQGIGVTFALLKNPQTIVSSVDYKFDQGNVTTPHSVVRISVWKTSGWLNGAPTTLVARSMRVHYNEYLHGNWRSFQMYPVNASYPINAGTGDPTASMPGAALDQGIYVFTLDNVGNDPAPAQNTVLIYPYTMPMVPGIADRFCASTTPGGYYFTDNFGPLGSFSNLGTRLSYLSTNITNPPTVAWGAGSTGPEFANFIFPMRVNMTPANKTDFAINYYRISGTLGSESTGISGAPFTPVVNVSSNSSQNGQQRDFNIRFEIFDAGNNRVYISDKVVYVNGWQTVQCTMDPWDPPTGGIYSMKASFSRYPDDENDVNNTLTSTFWVDPSRARSVVLTGGNVNQNDVNSTISFLKGKGITADVIDGTDPKLVDVKGSTIYVVGSVNDALKSSLANAVGNGNTIAFARSQSESIGKTVANIDRVFSIDRGRTIDYDNATLGAKVDMRPGYTVKEVKPQELNVKSKDELVNYIKSHSLKVDPVEVTEVTPVSDNSTFDSVIPNAVSSPFGTMTYINTGDENIEILYTIPQFAKAGTTKTDVTAPSAFNLEQNYPNPFNPSTVISYYLPQSSHVTLRVLDMLGREVLTLVDQKQDAGSYSVTWKGLDNAGQSVASGTYFYRIDAAPSSGGTVFSNVKKMTLSK